MEMLNFFFYVVQSLYIYTEKEEENNKMLIIIPSTTLSNRIEDEYDRERDQQRSTQLFESPILFQNILCRKAEEEEFSKGSLVSSLS